MRSRWRLRRIRTGNSLSDELLLRFKEPEEKMIVSFGERSIVSECLWNIDTISFARNWRGQSTSSIARKSERYYCRSYSLSLSLSLSLCRIFYRSSARLNAPKQAVKNTVISLNENEIFFFTTIHCNSVDVLPVDFYFDNEIDSARQTRESDADENSFHSTFHGIRCLHI